MPGIQYQIQISKTGTGAAETTRELQQVANTFAKTQAATTATGTAFNNLKLGTNATKDALHSMNSVAIMVGLQTFPQLTTAALTASQGMKAVKSASAALGVSSGIVGVTLAGLTAIVWESVEAWKALKAQQNAAATSQALADTFKKQADRLRDMVKQYRDLGKLTSEQADKMFAKLANPTSENLKSVRGDLRPVVGTLESEEHVQRVLDLTRQMHIAALEGFDQERAAAREAFSERMKQLVEEEAAIRKARGQTDNKSIPEIDSAEEAARRELEAKLQIIDANQVNLELDQMIAESQQDIADLERSIRDDRRQAAQERTDLERDFTLETLRSGKKREDVYQQEHDIFVALAKDQFERGIITAKEYGDTVKDLDTKLYQAMENAKRGVEEVIKSFGDLDLITRKTADGAVEYSATFNTALGPISLDITKINREIADQSAQILTNTENWKDLGSAFREVAANILQEMAKMIMQQAIFNALQAATKFLGFSSGGVAFAALGGTFPTYAANGLSGVKSVSQATYFPKFNVVAGEAGREMLTVLSKPRMMQIGGMEAAVGYAGSQRLAITDANQLAASRGGNAQGAVSIRVTLDPGLRAEIVESSVANAEVRVVNNMKVDSALSRATKELVR